MILRLLMEGLKVFLLFIISLLPKFPDMASAKTWIRSFFDLLHTANQFVSLPVIGFCLLSVLLCYNIRFVWSIVMWVVRKIPGVS